MEFIAKRDFTKGPVFSDAERSGTTTVGRTGLFEMFAAAERGEFQALVVEDLDRISRDIVDAHMMFRHLQELDIPIWSVSTGGVLTEEEVAFKSLIASREVHRARDRTRRGLELVVSKGRHVGSVGYGYRKVLKFDERGEPINGLREINESEANIIRRIFREYIAGVSPYAICVALNAECVPSPGGSKWTSGALTGSPAYSDGILRNTNFIGLVRFGRTVTKRKRGKVYQVPTDESARIVTEHPDLAIVDRATFDAAQERLAERGNGGYQTHRRATYLLTGKLWCGLCTEKYNIHKGKFDCTGKYQKGVCTDSRRVSRENLEEALLDELKAHLLAPELLDLSLAEYRKAAELAWQEHAHSAERSNKRLEEIAGEVEELKASIAQAAGKPRVRMALIEDLDRLLEEQENLQLGAESKPNPVAPALDNESMLAALLDTITHLQANLAGQTPEAIDAREKLRACIDQIIIVPTPGTVVDGKGAGPVTVTVEGNLSNFLDLSTIDVDHLPSRPSGTTFGLQDTVLEFSFTIRLRPDEALTRQVFADLPVVARLLDRAAVPVTLRDVAAAFGGTDDAPPDVIKDARWRAREAFNYLRSLKQVRRISGGPHWKGWVWEKSGLTDEEWRARARSKSPEKLKAPQFVTPPEAKVVIIRTCAKDNST